MFNRPQGHKAYSMTKQEKIQAAYGEHWKKVKELVDSNGTVPHGVYVGMGLAELGGEYFGCIGWRPKSLAGIETNNGWTKIETLADLPKESGHFYVLEGKKITSDAFDPRFGLDDKRWVKLYTHWQPIIKPQPPLY